MDRDPIDRRRYIRVKFPFSIHIYPQRKSPISAYTENISEVGIMVTVREAVEVPSVSSLLIYVEREPIACNGKAIWIKQKKSEYIDGGIFFDIGFEFQDLKGRDQSIIKEHVHALEKQREWAEQRKSKEFI